MGNNNGTVDLRRDIKILILWSFMVTTFVLILKISDGNNLNILSSSHVKFNIISDGKIRIDHGTEIPSKRRDDIAINNDDKTSFREFDEEDSSKFVTSKSIKLPSNQGIIRYHYYNYNGSSFSDDGSDSMNNKCDCEYYLIILGVGTGMSVNDYDMVSEQMILQEKKGEQEQIVLLQQEKKHGYNNNNNKFNDDCFDANASNIIVIWIDPDPHWVVKTNSKKFASVANWIVQNNGNPNFLPEMMKPCTSLLSRNIIIGGHSAGGQAAFHSLSDLQFQPMGYIGLDPYNMMSPSSTRNLVMDENDIHHGVSSSSTGDDIKAYENMDYLTNNGINKTENANDRSGVNDRSFHLKYNVEKRRTNVADASLMLQMPALFWGFSKTTCDVSVDKASKAGYNLHSNNTHRILYQIQNSENRCRADYNDSSKRRIDANAGVNRFCDVNHCIFTDNGCFGKICPLGILTRTKSAASTISAFSSNDKVKKEQKLIHTYVGQSIKHFVNAIWIETKNKEHDKQDNNGRSYQNPFGKDRFCLSSPLSDSMKRKETISPSFQVHETSIFHKLQKKSHYNIEDYSTSTIITSDCHNIKKKMMNNGIRLFINEDVVP